MCIPKTDESYLRNIVSRVIRDDPQAAETAIELLLLTDSSTPMGAAVHLKVLNILYDYTEDHQHAKERHFEDLKEKLGAIQVSASQ